MNRRSFLKALSAIPLLGIPVKLLANPEEFVGFNQVPDITMSNGSTITLTSSPDDVFKPAYIGLAHQGGIDRGLREDPFEDFVNVPSKRFWYTSKEMNEKWNLRSTIKWR